MYHAKTYHVTYHIGLDPSPRRTRGGETCLCSAPTPGRPRAARTRAHGLICGSPMPPRRGGCRPPPRRGRARTPPRAGLPSARGAGATPMAGRTPRSRPRRRASGTAGSAVVALPRSARARRPPGARRCGATLGGMPKHWVGSGMLIVHWPKMQQRGVLHHAHPELTARTLLMMQTPASTTSRQLHESQIMIYRAEAKRNDQTSQHFLLRTPESFQVSSTNR